MDSKLKNAVIRQLGGRDSLQDVCDHGVDAGFPGFTYYADTCNFYRRNRKAIVRLVEETAADFGQSPLEMVSGFNCLTRVFEKHERPALERAIAVAMYGTRRGADDDVEQVENALAWFALEETAREICDK